MSDEAILGEAAQGLYAVAPEEFVATRAAAVARVKAQGNAAAAREIGRLRRPSVAAWALNHLLRVDPDIVASLVGLGVRMRAAQGALDVGTLQALRADRDRIIDQFVLAATQAAHTTGRTLTPAVRDEVRATAVAALADQGAADALASGALTRSLSYSGFGEVDVSDAVVRTASGHILSVLVGGGLGADPASPTDDETSTPAHDPRALAQATLDDADAEVAGASTALTERERELTEAQARADEAAHLLSQAQQRVERTAAALAAARAAFAEADRRHRVAERARLEAAKLVAEEPAGP